MTKWNNGLLQGIPLFFYFFGPASIVIVRAVEQLCSAAQIFENLLSPGELPNANV
jgi:hypothetical protein